MGRIRLYLDEDVWVGLTAALRAAGYAAICASEVGRKGIEDEAQLSFVIANGRAILTHNIQDFVPLARLYAEQGLTHPGIIVASQFDKGKLLQRTLALLKELTPEQLANTLRFV
jgi:predicted nuclease of predicted toxin-antitoxin system